VRQVTADADLAVSVLACCSSIVGESQQKGSRLQLLWCRWFAVATAAAVTVDAVEKELAAHAAAPWFEFAAAALSSRVEGSQYVLAAAQLPDWKPRSFRLDSHFLRKADSAALATLAVAAEVLEGSLASAASSPEPKDFATACAPD